LIVKYERRGSITKNKDNSTVTEVYRPEIKPTHCPDATFTRA
jgi:hypothetical protein